MIRQDEQICKDLESLRNDARFQRVEDWMRKSLTSYRIAGDVLDGNDLYRNQGKCIILQSQLDAIHTSVEDLARIARNSVEGTAA